MKKCIFALLSFFFLVPLVFAETLIDQEVSNGKVSLGIKTDQGYMDAFEAEIKVSDNVTIKNFTWDNFLDTMAVKESSISSDKKTIHFVVSAKASNILLASKTIPLGVLEVTSEQDVDYSFNLSQFSFTDLGMENKGATRLNQSEKQYHFVAKKEESQPTTPSESEPSNPSTQTPEKEPSNPGTQTPEKEPSNPSGGTSSGSTGNENPNNTNNGSSSQGGSQVEQDSSSSSGEKPTDDEEEDKKEEKPSSSDTNKEDINDKDNKENDKEVREETKNMNQAILLYITLGGIVICLIILLIMYCVRKK